MDILLIGFTKCGSTSLEKYLKEQGNNVVRQEQAFYQVDPEGYRRRYKGYQIHMIIRDPVLRTFSAYHWDKYTINRFDLDFFEAVQAYPDIIENSMYDKFIKLWKPDCVWYLEHLQENKRFPFENAQEYKETLTPEIRQYIERRLE